MPSSAPVSRRARENCCASTGTFRQQREFPAQASHQAIPSASVPRRNDVSVFKQQLRDALTAAMKERDKTAVTALRSALAAIDNAEAVEARDLAAAVSDHIAGAVAGLGAGEVERRTLTMAEAATIVTAEATTRQVAAEEYERLGQIDGANRLRAEAAVLLGRVALPPADRQM